MTSFAIVPVRTIRSPRPSTRAAILLGGALAIATTPALAELRVRGSAEAVIIETRDTPVEEVLAALSRAFNMRYQSSINLDKRLSRTYAGPLSRVLPRILDGYNFVLKTDSGQIVVAVLGTPNGPAVSVPASSAPRVVRQPAEGTAQAGGAGEGLARPQVSASTAAPSPVVERGEEPSFPTPALPSSGAPPAPVPELRQSEAAAVPIPPAPGSKASPAPEPGRPADASSPPAAPAPPQAK